MGPRVSAKALIVHNGRMLLNQCEDTANGLYYTLPGGGQRQYEPLEHTVVREVLEETGYLVHPLRLAGIYEEIFTDPSLRAAYPAYTHRLYLIFLCELSGEEQAAPTETDMSQKSCVWIDCAALPAIRMLPEVIGIKLPAMLSSGNAVFLGTGFTDENHG